MSIEETCERLREFEARRYFQETTPNINKNFIVIMSEYCLEHTIIYIFFILIKILETMHVAAKRQCLQTVLWCKHDLTA
jgi:hypothetical protein